MTNPVTFKVLEDIARDLSGSEITFPTFLDITFQVRAALKDPNLSVEQLSKLVGAEPLMSAKIIRMSNWWP
jgi:HD-like signal output (HDOD) protein